jgi:RND superfamily putative drug exporter
MSSMARWCFAHRKLVVPGWLLALMVVLTLSQAVGHRFNASFGLPHTDSQAAVDVLERSFPAGTGETDQVVIEATGGTTISSPQVRSAVTVALARVARVPGVESVNSPYRPGGAAQVSRGRTVAFATVRWDKPATAVSKVDARRLITAAESADGPHVHVSLGGQSISSAEGSGTGASVGVGIIAALVILLVVFGGALLSSLMPLITAGVALLIGTALIGLLSHLFSIPSVATDMAVLIGLGVGVDYGLFIVSRHRSAVRSGLPYQDAVVQAVNTSGRTVVFAGITVCVALLGQLALGVGFLNGLSLASATAVALTMATSLTFLPAMLGFLGPKVLSRRERARLAADGPVVAGGPGLWARWANLVQTRKVVVAVGSVAVVALIASPVFSLRLGASDAETDPSHSTTHQAYQTLARGFGPGFNGPLELVAELGSTRDAPAFDRLVAAIGHLPDVAEVGPVTLSPNGRAAVATIYPATSPQSAETTHLVNQLRKQVAPAAEEATGLVVHVGGATATNIDFTHVLGQKLIVFVVVVVILAFVLLTIVFRSLLIPLVASLMNLLSVGAALGALSVVFTRGWGASLLGLSGAGPIDAWLPVLLFSVLFGLSMDYEVYLVSRIHEEWRYRHGGHPHDDGSNRRRSIAANHLAVTAGQAKSGRVIAGAAGIMILVFGSFMLGGLRQMSEFGFGLAFAVLLDAFLIRMMTVPAIMHIAGRANWWVPRWLGRRLPQLAIETDAEPETAVCQTGHLVVGVGGRGVDRADDRGR